jgi:hypothetical protein
MIEAASRLHGVEALIDMKQYFVIHAARQSGKTTYLRDLTQRLNAGGKYHALYCSLEVMQGIPEPERGIPTVLDCIVFALRNLSIPFVYTPQYEQGKEDNPLVVLVIFLTELVKQLDKPLVIFFDEADCLSEGTLISFLRQLRDGYNSRAYDPFVHSIALVGMRDIRDYKARIRPDSQSLGSASPFNIVTESLTLQNFTKEEIASLYRQHTGETGQTFDDDAVELVWQQTQGQPWLVNAVAREVIVKMLQSDYAKPVTAGLVRDAIQTIILRRDVHIDSLRERLKEERVRKIIEAVILGELIDTSSDDFYYVRDLGLIRVTPTKIEPANPIYAEVIVRTLNYNLQDNLQRNNTPYQMPRYLRNGRIDMDYLMRDFQQFWRENSAIWTERFDYKEAAPHLIMMAFLQRVVNGGGQILREIAAEKGRLDLCIVYEEQKYPLELKLWRGDSTLEKGLEQTARYMDAYGCTEGWLALFDRRPEMKWDDKLYMRKHTVDGKTITVVGV